MSRKVLSRGSPHGSSGGRSGARPHARRRRTRFDHGAPISRIDTRPIAILAACGAAFFMVFFKPPTHALLFDLTPQHAKLPSEGKRLVVNPRFNQVTVTSDDRILWNCEAVTAGQLALLLQRATASAVEPYTLFYAQADASYNLAAKTLQIVWASGITKFEFAGLAQHQKYERSSQSGWAPPNRTLAIELSPPPLPEETSREWRGDTPLMDLYSLCDEEVGA